ncbi:MAG: thiamine-phosphate kinase [Gemmatimonadaceae bacterium]|nr:thiamine-phosphate kinase [Gemmatimonadaceae bacterium]
MTVHRAHQAMGPGHEFDTIRMLMDRWGDLAVDIGDDAAVLPVRGDALRVVSTDACVEGAHFRREWITPFDVGVRATAAAISDIAAMGARVDAILVALIVPEAWRPLLGDVADGIAQVVRASGARIVGGNLSRGDVFAITTTAIGSATRVVSRHGAKPGDVMVVTGVLGGPGNATRALYAGQTPSPWARSRFVAPAPRLAEGAALAAAGAHAMLDISDGLVADARHLAAASGVRVRIDASQVPTGEGIDPSAALSSGEEYELLAALPPEAAKRLLAEWPGRFSVPLTVIGAVTSTEAGGSVAVEISDGVTDSRPNTDPRVEFDSGHDHFSR